MDVVTIAEDQYGLITRAQAASSMSRSAIDRRLATAKWVPVFPGVYRIAGVPTSKRQRMMAAMLWGGDNAAASHPSAAELLQLRDLRLPGMHLTVAADAGGRLRGVTLHRSTLTRSERANVDGIRCTSATRTLVDCAGAVDAELLEAAFEAARRMGLTSVESVARLLGRGRAGSAKMRRVLGMRRSGRRNRGSR